MQPRTFSLRYRPQTFAELFDQEHIKKTLINAISSNRLAHAYLFTGPRGVGKTTTARILAKSLNCNTGPTINPCNKCSACIEITASKSLDVLEIDGASNRGIDQIRELRENIKYRPTSGRYRIYIIDEVHMLTTEAFNALLKTLEEPPSHVIFIFATTEPHKVPATILSRCQRFDFKRIPTQVITQRLKMIIESENLEIEEKAVSLIADIADGGLRDAESILEQITTFKGGKVNTEDITELLGIVPYERFSRTLELIVEGSETGVLQLLEDTFGKGYDVAEFYFGFVSFLRSLLFARLGMQSSSMSILVDDVISLSKALNPKQLAAMLEIFLKAEEAFKKSRQKVVFLETLVLSLIDAHQYQSAEISGKDLPPRDLLPEKTKPSIENPGANDETRANGKNQSSEKEKSSGEKGSSGEKKSLGKAESAKGTNNNYSDDDGDDRQTLSATEAWTQVLDEISSQNSFLSRGLKDSIVIKSDQSLLCIGITADPEVNIKLLEEEREILEKKLLALSGLRIRIEFQANRKKEDKPALETKSTVVDDALDIFKGEIVR